MVDKTASPAADGAQSIRRAVAVLRVLAAGQEFGVRLTDVAGQCELNRPTAHRILRVLVGEGLAEQDPASRRYIIGYEAPLLGLARRSPIPIRRIADPFLREICEECGDSVFLTVRSRSDSICVDRKTGRYPIQVLAVEVGARRPLGVGVGGLVMLAFLAPEEVDAVLRTQKHRLLRQGLSLKAFEELIELTRARGYAYTETGIVPGTRAVAVPVLQQDGQPIAAISISTIALRLSAERARNLAALMRDRATKISTRLAKAL